MLYFSQLTDNKSMQSMCQMYAAVSYICLGDPESTSQVLSLSLYLPAPPILWFFFSLGPKFPLLAGIILYELDQITSCISPLGSFWYLAAEVYWGELW